MKFNNRYSESKNIGKVFTKPSLTDQQFKQECDIGFIVENYAKLGKTIDNSNLNYFDCTSVQEYQDALYTVANAKSNFESLPSKDRDRFGSVENYLEFVSNAANLKESYERGYIDRSSVDLSDVYPERYGRVLPDVETPVVEPPSDASITPSEPQEVSG